MGREPRPAGDLQQVTYKGLEQAPPWAQKQHSPADAFWISRTVRR